MSLLSKLKQPLQNHWGRQRHRVAPNVAYKDKHKGETCFIFGNGGSLKYYDLSALPSNVAIACSFALVDRRLRRLNVKYNILSDSYCLYPVVYNDYIDAVQRNPQRAIFRRLIARNPDVTFFTSITNSYAFATKPRNLRYWHHFGVRDFSSADLAGNFSTCSGALDSMIGLARYMGFSKALLFGCDYLCVPKLEGHFYAYAPPRVGLEDEAYAQRILKCVGDMEVVAVCPKGIGSRYFASVNFEEQFGAPEVYQTNEEIIEPADLELLLDAQRANLIFL